jgi:hypothetical protein
MGRPFMLPPDVPRDRATALQRAFDEALKDKDLIADADKRGIELDPVGGASIAKLLDTVYSTPPSLAEPGGRELGWDLFPVFSSDADAAAFRAFLAANGTEARLGALYTPLVLAWDPLVAPRVAAVKQPHSTARRKERQPRSGCASEAKDAAAEALAPRAAGAAIDVIGGG